MYYIGLDVHKKTVSYCVKDVSGQIQQEGKVGSTRRELDCWMKTLPRPWTVAMEATIFSGWIYDHLLPHAAQIKVAHPLMLRAIAAAKKKNDKIDAGKLADCLRCDFLRLNESIVLFSPTEAQLPVCPLHGHYGLLPVCP
jgi:transposase